MAIRAKCVLLPVALLIATACATAEPPASAPQGDLDVPMTHEEKAAAEPPLTYADVVPKKGEDATLKVPKAAVTNWQAFFRPPPTPAERNLLTQRLDKWSDVDNAKDLVAKGRDEVAVGRYVAAEADFRKALRLKPDDLGAALELAGLFLRKKAVGNAFEFLAQVKEGISTTDDVPQSLIFRYRYTLALGLIARGDLDKGHKVLSDLIGVDKSFAPAYASLATSYLAVGRDQVAEFVVRRGLDRIKDNAPLLNLMGVIAQKARQLDSARTWYDKALTASPSYAPALVNRAALNALNIEYSAAEEDLRQALKIDPQSVDALVSLGIVQRRQGNATGARSSFAKAVDIDPDNAYARFNLAVLLADELKKPGEALRLFHEVMQTTGAGSELHELAHNYINDLKTIGSPM